MNKMVSVIIVCRNEAEYIIPCIQSIEKQFLPDEEWELIVVDGDSEDETRKLAWEYLQIHANYPWHLLDNPKRTLATGWNMAIQKAAGEYLIRPDAHGELMPDYIRQARADLEAFPQVAAVGGLLETRAHGKWGQIIRLALSSRIGVGNSSFRTGAPSGSYDTVVYGLYRKAVFQQVGLFNETLVRHQDTEFHQRVRTAGWEFRLNNQLTAIYYCRNTVRLLGKQMFNIGRYLPDLIKTGGMRPRHMAPALFFVGLLTLLLLGRLYPLFCWLAGFGLGAYCLGIVLSAIALQRDRASRGGRAFALLFVIPLMHLCYAAGTVYGLLGKWMGWYR